MITHIHVRIGYGVHLRTYLWGIRIWTGPRLYHIFDDDQLANWKE